MIDRVLILDDRAFAVVESWNPNSIATSDVLWWSTGEDFTTSSRAVVDRAERSKHGYAAAFIVDLFPLLTCLKGHFHFYQRRNALYNSRIFHVDNGIFSIETVR